MPSPRPTPTALKILRGNPGKRPLNRREPTPDALDVAIPNELTDPVARAEWTRAIVPAIKIGIVTIADRTLAIAHCELWATWRSQLADAAAGTHVVRLGKGYRQPNPVRGMANKTLQLLMRVDDQLGFSPTSRSRVVVNGPGSTRAAVDTARAKFFDTGRG